MDDDDAGYDTDDLGGGSSALPSLARSVATTTVAITTATDDDDDLSTSPISRHLPHGFELPVTPLTTTQRPSTKIVTASSTPNVLDPAVDQDIEHFNTFVPKDRAKRKNAAIVGKTGPRTIKRYKGTSKADEHDKHALLEETLPSYLKDRKSEWEERRHVLKLHGLLLPPEFDDLDFSDDENLDGLEERPDFTHIQPVNEYEDIQLPKSVGVIPAPIARWLRDYQIEGAAFLHEAFVYQKGVILGDDMGLGKTIQVISFLTAAFGKTGDARDAKRMRKARRAGDNRWYPRVLIIARGSLMANWQRELETWGWWEVYQYHGATKQAALRAAESGRLEIMLTTYTTYCNDASAINAIRWDCVIADECHEIKNNRRHTTQIMNDVNALCRIGLTGTAIQNTYEELWTILNWTSPSQLGSLSLWKDTISDPVKAGQSHDATVAQLAKARETAENLVKYLLPRFFLRRMKTLIADQLPKKSDKVVFCPMTDLQADAYANFCGSELVKAMVHASEPCPCNSGKTQGRCCFAEVDGIEVKKLFFPALLILQKLSNHLGLLPPSMHTDREKHDRELEFLKMSVGDEWRRIYGGRESVLNFANQEYCGKWKVLKEMLKLWHRNGDKVLIFSHSVRLLKMLHALFKTKTSYTMSFLDGSMSYEERQIAVDKFNDTKEQFVFLISTKTGGVGLNITSANKVVVFDPNWNPAWDMQAQDRAYRIGQTRDVDVFRLVSAGTIEENIYARQIYKQQQANVGYNATAERRYFQGVQAEAKQKGELFGLANLLAPVEDRMALRDIMNKTNIAESKAGFMIAGLDVEASPEDNRDSDTVMSELAESMVDGASTNKRKSDSNPKTKDPIQAVLDAAGVSYTHENAEVIGTSKIEMQISSRARQAGEKELMDRKVFAGSQADAEHATGGQDKVSYTYNPPEDVRKRQFCSMSKFMGFDDISQFALTVEGWTQQQRRNFLERFYAHRREVLTGVQE